MSQFEKRELTTNEISDIFSFIPINKGIPLDIELERINRIKQNMTKQLIRKKIYIKLIPKLKEILSQMYFRARVHPGESVGTLGATYIGEIQTQLTLNTFHFAGLSTFSVGAGVPRFLEILNISKNMKQPSITLQFKNSSKVEDKYRLTRRLKEITLTNLISEKPEIYYCRKLSNEEEVWYNTYYTIYDSTIHDEEDKFLWSIRFNISTNKLYEYSLSLHDIVNKIQRFRDLYCVCSPDNIGIIDVFPDISELIVPELEDENGNNKTPHIYEENKAYHYIIDFVIPSLLNHKVSAIDNIKEVHFRYDKNDWICETDGSNLRELFTIDFLDHEKLITNDIIETYNVLGVEAARTVIINEITKILSFGGYINPAWIRVLADTMTQDGKLSSVNRHGVSSDIDTLASASNEIPFEHLVNSIGKEDQLKCISSNVMLGKLGNMGTGMFKLLVDDKCVREDKKDDREDLMKCLDKDFVSPIKKDVVKNERNERKEEKKYKKTVKDIVVEKKVLNINTNRKKRSPGSDIGKEFSSDDNSPSSGMVSSPDCKNVKKNNRKRNIFS
jgi:DNA-directed RNA polymerase beta' subunit